MSKVFFASYSHVNNRDGKLAQVIKALSDEVLQGHYPALKEEDIVFFDSEGIQTGAEWEEKLGDALCQSKVCVAFLSPHYIDSDFCGKELQVFVNRFNDWQRNSVTPADGGAPIIPVLWIKAAPLPDALSKFQYVDQHFPEEYTQHGLRTLAQLSKFDNQKKEVLQVLAERIIYSAKRGLPDSEGIPHFDYIQSLFHRTAAGMRYGVAAMALVPGEFDFKPYGGERTLRRLLQESCSSFPVRELKQNRELAQFVAAAKANREVVCLITNLPTLNDPAYLQAIAAIDGCGGQQTVLLVMCDSQPPGAIIQTANLEITLRGCFHHSFADFWHCSSSSITSVETLRESFEKSVTAARTRLVDADPARAATDPALEAEAKADGVPTSRQPILSGPGGK